MADGVSKDSEEEVRVWGEGRGGMPKRQNVAYFFMKFGSGLYRERRGQLDGVDESR